MLKLQEITTAHVVSVYSGKLGKCMCGCSGNHRVNPEHRELAGKRRGYAISDDEVNLAQVTRVLRLIQAEGETAKIEAGLGGETIVYATVGKRELVAYLRLDVESSK